MVLPGRAIPKVLAQPAAHPHAEATPSEKTTLLTKSSLETCADERVTCAAALKRAMTAAGAIEGTTGPRMAAVEVMNRI